MLRELHEELGIPADYGQDGSPPAFDEALELVDIGPNLVGRMQSLTRAAAENWRAMVVVLDKGELRPGFYRARKPA